MLEKLPTWQRTKVMSKKEVIQEAQKEGRTVDFATLMDMCHLKTWRWIRGSKNTKDVLYSEVTL